MMNMPAARLTDLHVCAMCPPGAPILGPGCPTVLTGKLPQARMTDLCVCVPPPPLGPGDAIATGSPTVLIGKLPAARITDLTAKGGAITTGQPTVLIGLMGLSFPKMGGFVATTMLSQLAAAGAAISRGASDGFAMELFSNDFGKLLSVKWTPGVQSGGALGSASGKFEFRLLEFKGLGHVEVPIVGGLGAEGKFTVLPIDLELKGGVVRGADLSGKARIAWWNAQGSGMVGEDPNNPMAELGIAVNALQAEASGEATLGEGGASTGVALRGKAAGEVVSGDIFGERNIDVGDGNTLSGRAKISGALVTAGGELGGWAEQDKQTGRGHAGGVGQIKAGGGIGLAGDLSAGPRYTSRDGRKI